LSYQWPEPDFEFLAGGSPSGDSGLYFVCHGNEVLQNFSDDGNWRPATEEEVAHLLDTRSHFMGHLGNQPCYAVEAQEKGDQEFANLRMYLGRINDTLFNLAGRSLQLCDWYRSHRFCGKCGSPTSENESDRSMVCRPCGINYYPRLSPSIIVLVHREDEVLLARNHMFPEGLFSTLAGFVEPGESIEETVRREVEEEVGVRVGNLRYRGSQPWPFPNSLMLGFHAEYESGEILCQQDEIAEANWFACNELPNIPGKFAISRWLIDAYLAERGFDY